MFHQLPQNEQDWVICDCGICGILERTTILDKYFWTCAAVVHMHLRLKAYELTCIGSQMFLSVGLQSHECG